jgi:hypothetical protein
MQRTGTPALQGGEHVRSGELQTPRVRCQGPHLTDDYFGIWGSI